MLKTSAIVAALAIAATSVAEAKPACRDAKGHFAKCPAAAPASAPASTPASAGAMGSMPGMPMPAGHPQCKKGKPCGNSCIAMNKVCHK